MKDDHNRFKVVSEQQHLYEHSLDEFPYAHPAIPGASTAADALDYVLNVIYPNIKASVATPADLPTGVDTPNVGDVTPDANDQRIVLDDGDGKAAMYLWAKYDGEAVYSWHKIADIDWGQDSIIQALQSQTQYLYVRKFGTTDYDPVTELALTGIDAGQHIYGGDIANQHLTLHANNGDPVGNTGFIQFEDHVRPYTDSTFNLGTNTERFLAGYFDSIISGTMTVTGGSITDTSGAISFGDENLSTTGNIDGAIVTGSSSVVADTMTMATGSITDSTGAISFGDENLSTTGTFASADITVDSDLVLSSGSITSVSGAISFGDENLSTTGTLGAGVTTVDALNVDDIQINANSISIVTADTDLVLAANGTGVIDVNSKISGGNADFVGAVIVVGSLNIDNITFDGDNMTNTSGNIFTDSNLVSTGNGVDNLGAAGSRWQNIYLSSALSDGTNQILMSELLSFRSAGFRDGARTQPVQAGDALFWSGTQWLASAPDTEIAHELLSNLTTGDAGHTQFAMLAGRAGGQTIIGDTGAGSLSLRGNATSNGIDLSNSLVAPSITDTISLGSSGLKFNNVYMKGQLFGSRLENVAGTPTFDAAEVGRVSYNTSDDFIYVNDGTAFKKVGHNTYNAIHTNTQVEAGVDVSASVSDARDCIWQLCDQINEEVMGVTIQKTATTVTIVTAIPLPSANYRLMGIEL